MLTHLVKVLPHLTSWPTACSGLFSSYSENMHGDILVCRPLIRYHSQVVVGCPSHRRLWPLSPLWLGLLRIAVSMRVTTSLPVSAYSPFPSLLHVHVGGQRNIWLTHFCFAVNGTTCVASSGRQLNSFILFANAASDAQHSRDSEWYFRAQAMCVSHRHAAH